MGPKEAVDVAKKYVSDVFATDHATNVGLEELRYDESSKSWLVTIGFSRAWDRPLMGASDWLRKAPEPLARTFKVVEVSDSDGRVIEVTHRSLAA